MQLGLEGKVAIVGGASRGLGRACAERLAREGVSVVMVSRHAGELDQAAETIASVAEATVLPVAADQGSSDGVRRIIDEASCRFGSIDILVNNTGGPPPGLFEAHDDRAWQAAFEGLVLSVVRLCRAVIPGMRSRGWGRIVNNTSFTVKEPADRLVLSNALRAAVVGLSKTLSRELAADGVTVNCVCPGAFDTQRLQKLFLEQADAQGRTPDDVRRAWEAGIPIGRILRPEELADLIAFLASDRAAGITGTSVAIEGGMLHGLL